MVRGTKNQTRRQKTGAALLVISFFFSKCTVFPNNREGMTEFFSLESTNNFWTNFIQKYLTIGVNEIKRALFQQKSENLPSQNGQLYALKNLKYHTFLAFILLLIHKSLHTSQKKNKNYPKFWIQFLNSVIPLEHSERVYFLGV